jgi:beta-glucosidase
LKKDLGLLQVDGWKSDKKLQRMTGNRKDREVALNTARESMTLLKNTNQTLPFNSDKIKHILVVGPTGNNLAHLSGGWTIDWQG